ncbi:MAG: hypothetical protein WCW27_02230 [Patescibacteria group bacterium]|jgi:hypothetical protein
MDTFQTNIFILIVFLIDCISALILTLVIYSALFKKHKTSRKIFIRSAILTSIAIFTISCAFIVLSSIPMLNFIDRCKPAGEEMCTDKRAYSEVYADIHLDLIKLSMLYIVIPNLLGPTVLLLIYFARKHQTAA